MIYIQENLRKQRTLLKFYSSDITYFREILNELVKLRWRFPYQINLSKYVFLYTRAKKQAQHIFLKTNT